MPLASNTSVFISSRQGILLSNYQNQEVNSRNSQESAQDHTSCLAVMSLLFLLIWNGSWVCLWSPGWRLKRIGRLFCRVPLEVGLPSASSQSGSGYTLLAGTSQKWSCVLLTASYPEAPAINLSHFSLCQPRSLGEGGACWASSTVKLLFYHLSVIRFLGGGPQTMSTPCYSSNTFCLF